MSTIYGSESWLLLYGLATKQTAERVSLWRKLKKFGALQLKSSATCCGPPAHFDDFNGWPSTYATDGGEATLIRVPNRGSDERRDGPDVQRRRALEYRGSVKSLARIDRTEPEAPPGIVPRTWTSLPALQVENTARSFYSDLPESSRRRKNACLNRAAVRSTGNTPPRWTAKKFLQNLADATAGGKLTASGSAG